jgi:tRNA1(Val) A37 N6-methylase TrmN6
MSETLLNPGGAFYFILEDERLRLIHSTLVKKRLREIVGKALVPDAETGKVKSWYGSCPAVLI